MRRIIGIAAFLAVGCVENAAANAPNPICYIGVVAAGGIGGGYRVQDTETWDPGSNTWIVDNLLPRSLSDLAMAPVSVSGTCGVMAVGGQSNYGTEARTWYLDPTGTWNQMASLNVARFAEAAAPVCFPINGTPVPSVLTVGGEGPTGCPGLASAEFYDPNATVWSLVAPMSGPRYGLAAAPVTIGGVAGVLAVGGELTYSTQLATAEFWNPITNSWTLRAPMITPRGFHAAAPVTIPIAGTPVAGVLAMGGVTGGCTPVAAAEFYNPNTDSWTPVAPMPSGRYSLGAAPIIVPVSGTPVTGVLAVGGGGPACCPSDANFYNPVTNSWTPQATLPIGRTDLAAAAIICTCTPTITATSTPTGTPTTTVCGDPGLCVDRNAFNAAVDVTTIHFVVSTDENVKVTIFNSAGEYITDVWSGPATAHQIYAVPWDGTNRSGRNVASGVYIVRLNSLRERLWKKVGVVR